MIARLSSWWQQIKKHWVAILVVAIILGIAVALTSAEIRVYGTGFTGKTLWDWLQLLIIPLILAIIALLFNLANSYTERQIAKQHYEQDQQIAKQRYENDQHIALDKQREDLLQVYLDRMSELMLEKNLRTSQPNTEVRNVARVRTITILFQLDARRIGYVFAFLRESGLMSINSDENIVSLSQADLNNLNLSQANLSGANLSGASLRQANLIRAHLGRANLREADLSEAHLGRANLREADLREADLNKSDLSGTNLSRANLGDANLSKANPSNALQLHFQFEQE